LYRKAASPRDLGVFRRLGGAYIADDDSLAECPPPLFHQTSPPRDRPSRRDSENDVDSRRPMAHLTDNVAAAAAESKRPRRHLRSSFDENAQQYSYGGGHSQRQSHRQSQSQSQSHRRVRRHTSEALLQSPGGHSLRQLSLEDVAAAAKDLPPPPSSTSRRQPRGGEEEEEEEEDHHQRSSRGSPPLDLRATRGSSRGSRGSRGTSPPPRQRGGRRSTFDGPRPSLALEEPTTTEATRWTLTSAPPTPRTARVSRDSFEDANPRPAAGNKTRHGRRDSFDDPPPPPPSHSRELEDDLATAFGQVEIDGRATIRQLRAVARPASQVEFILASEPDMKRRVDLHDLLLLAAEKSRRFRAA